jgi:hypothetical protein
MPVVVVDSVLKRVGMHSCETYSGMAIDGPDEFSVATRRRFGRAHQILGTPQWISRNGYKVEATVHWKSCIAVAREIEAGHGDSKSDLTLPSSALFIPAGWSH